MSECIKGRLEIAIECCNAITILSKEDSSQVAQVMDEDGNDLTDAQITTAKEIVRRWNAFEEGGLVDELRTALENLTKQPNCEACQTEAEAALAKS